MRAIRVITIAGLVLACAGSAAAQSNKLGVFGGANLAKLNYDPAVSGADNTRRPGPAAGVIGQLGLGAEGTVALRLSPMWEQKGGKLTVGGVAQKSTLNYAEVPLMLVVMPPAGSVRPYFMAGPSVGFLLSAKEQAGNGPSVDIKGDMESTTLSARLGAGLVFTAGQNGLFFEGEYSRAMKSVMKPPAPPSEQSVDIRTNGIRMNVGLMFPFGD